MKLPLYIAWRYLFARKSAGVINLISAISAVGMAVGTAALVLILSVYNGFDRIIRDNLSDVDPDLRVSPAAGKTFVPEGPAFDWLYEQEAVGTLCSVIEEQVFLSYEGRQGVALARGVDRVYEEENDLSRHVAAGEWILRRGDVAFAAVGAGLAGKMGIHPRFLTPIELYYPDRSAPFSPARPLASLHQEKVWPGSLLTVGSDWDEETILLPIETMRRLTGYGEEISAVEVRLAPGQQHPKKALRRLKKEMEAQFGPDYRIADRYQQHPALYKMMRYEKAAVYLILIFIVLIIALNIFGSLSMLIIEKREDRQTLRALGASEPLIRRIFVLEGWLISLLGMAAGLVIGVALALLQQHLGLVKMPGNFLVAAYPVVLRWTDVLLTAAGVGLIGLLVALAPASGTADT